MSRQFDELIDNSVNISGEPVFLISPTSFEELANALKVKDMIQAYLDSGMYDEHNLNNLKEGLQEQEQRINDYILSLGEFNNTLLISNINFYLKKYDMRVRELEAMLELSVGYISRTAKENSGKKLSVDVAWKIAKIFNVSLNSLLEDDLSVANSSNELLNDFISKISHDTSNNIIRWFFDYEPEDPFGWAIEAKNRMKELGLLKSENEYSMKDLADHVKWYFSDIVVGCHFRDKRNILLIPYRSECSEETMHYDLVFVWKDKGKLIYEKAFDSMQVEELKSLYTLVREKLKEARISNNVRSIITDYLKN